MRDILFDFRRTFLGRYTMIAFLIIILVSVGTAYLVTLSGQSPRSNLGLLEVSFSEFGGVLGTVIPILATLSSYFYYGKDKANSVIESIVTLPVTRGRLIFSRYFANVSSMVLAFVIGLGIYQIILYEEMGVYLSLYHSLFLIWAILVEIAAFTGLVYLASQFLESQAGILGIALALILIFGLFWNGDITYLVLHFANISLYTNAYVQGKLIMEAVSPGGYAMFAVFLYAPSNGNGVALTASTFGVTQLTVYLLGLSWMLIPTVLAILVGRKRD